VSVQLNHTIVSCRDQQRSAAFLSGILGLPPSSTAITSARTRGRRSARSSRPGGAWFGNVRFAFRHPDAVHSAGVVHRGGYDPPTLLAALATSE